MDRPIQSWLVVGADGAIGRELFRRLQIAGVPTVGTTRRPGSYPSMLHIDLGDDPSTWQLPEHVDVAFLCAAVTSIDRCRQSPAETRFVNVEQTLRLAERLRSRDAHVVFLSTNQVFDGEHARQRHDAPQVPRTEYGRQKAEVEQALLKLGSSTVVRFTKVAASNMKLLHQWCNTLARGETIAPLHDIVMSPVPLAFAAEVLQTVGKRKPGGIVQVSGECDVSYAEVALRLARRLRVSPDLVRPIAVESAGLARELAPRNTTLNIARLAGLGLSVPPVCDTIDALIEEVVHE